MPAFTIKRLSVEEAKAEFKRTGSNLEKLDDYVDTLRDMGLGEAITVKVQGQFVDEEADGKTIQKWVEVVPDTVDSDGEADTVRAFKRRMNAAAGSLGFKLKWKNKGHREGDGDNARFVMDWLSALAVSKDVDTSEDGDSPGK